MAIALGWLDTNIFVHALIPGHREYTRCVTIIDALTDGRAEGWITPLVLHELSYVLARFPAYNTRATVATYLLTILNAIGVYSENTPTLLATVGRWAATPTIGFVDAYLAELALRDALPVCSANARDFPGMANSYVSATL